MPNLLELQHAVLSRMAGCDEEGCLACKANLDVLLKYVNASRADERRQVYEEAYKAGLSDAHLRPGNGLMGG